MKNFLDQPWWVDLAVIVLPFLVVGVAYYLIAFRGCCVCRHQATKWNRKWYCERCYRKVFGAPVVIQGAAAAALPVPPPTNGTPQPKPVPKRQKPRRPARASKR